MSLTIFIIFGTVMASYWAWQRYDAFEKYTFKPYRVWNNQEYYRFFTSTFLHVDWMHLFFNMFTFFFFGPMLENYFDMFSDGKGWIYLSVLFLSSMVVSELGTLFKYKHDRSYNSLGASGAVSAVLFAGIWFQPTERILVMFIPMPGFAFGALYLLYTAYAAKNDLTGRINHDAHLYGSVWGILFNIICFPQSIGYFFDALIRFQIF
jgi:membrane associated rhomboid family serine protease